MHIHTTSHPIIDVALGTIGMLFCNLHSIAENTVVADFFTLIGWCAITVSAVRSAMWLARKIKK